MPSKAIASLDAWLLRAEEVLAEQREHRLRRFRRRSGYHAIDRQRVQRRVIADDLAGARAHRLQVFVQRQRRCRVEPRVTPGEAQLVQLQRATAIAP